MSIYKHYSSVFPFNCDTCGRTYHFEDFIHVALLWGFIYLASSKNQVIGFTCPACQGTSIRKYRLSVEDFSIELMENACNVLDIGKIKKPVRFREFVPFSKRVLYTEYSEREDRVPFYERIPPLPLFQGISLRNEFFRKKAFDRINSAEEIYTIPEFISPQMDSYPYNIQIDIPYNLPEPYIAHLSLIENSIRRKSIPRIYSNYNVYKYTEEWLRTFPFNEGTPLRMKKDLVKAFESAANFKNISAHKELILNNMGLSAKYVNLFSDLVDTWYRQDSPARFEYFRGYRRVRNQIDYDLNYRDKFVMNYMYGAFTAPPKPKRKVTIFEKHRKACRVAARKILKKEGDLNYASFSKHPDIIKACDGKKYGVVTIKKYLKGLRREENIKPGRPKKE